jgi:hypothetical protein
MHCRGCHEQSFRYDTEIIIIIIIIINGSTALLLDRGRFTVS